MQDFDFLVVGGGFQGIISAILLAQRKYSVCLIEKSRAIGGILRGADYDGLILDFGCHLFGNVDADVTNVIHEIMDGQFHPVDLKYSNITQEHHHDEIAVPSFSHWDDDKQALAMFSLLKHISSHSKKVPQNASEYFIGRYGRHYGSALDKITRKLTQLDANSLSISSAKKFPLGRIYISEHIDMIRLLKQNSVLDSCLALKSQSNPMKFYQDAKNVYKNKNYYPAQGGMRGFCVKAEEYLRKNNVSIYFGEALKNIHQKGKYVQVTLANGVSISGKNCIWTLDTGALSQIIFGENRLADFSHNLPLVLFYFFISKESQPNYTYIHNFSEENFIYRVSSSGFYGCQVNKDGRSFICAEVPTSTQNDIFKSPEKYYERIWQEICSMGMLDSEQPYKVHHIAVPASIPLYKAGYEVINNELMENISEMLPSLINVNEDVYGKNNIVKLLHEKVGKTV